MIKMTLGLTCLFWISFSTLANQSDPPVIERSINFIKAMSSACFWVDGVGQNGIGQVFATNNMEAGAGIICSGTIKCKADPAAMPAIDPSFTGTYWPDVYFEYVACPGERLTSGRVRCGYGQNPSDDIYDCLKRSTDFTRVEVNQGVGTGTQIQVSPSSAPVRPSNFEKSEVVN